MTAFGEVYHFSEEPDIDVFRPRPSSAFPELPPVVWAIDPSHAAHYLFPRDCPRVIFWPKADTSPADRERLFGGTAAAKIVVVECGWLERIRRTRLTRYVFDAAPFEPFAGAPTSGYRIAREAVFPVRVEPVGSLLDALLADGAVELRFTPRLQPIRDAVVRSTSDFSIIRFRNAAE